jgi:hypothetical protein
MKEISKFYKSLVQEVVIRQRANEEGDSQEQTFTRYCMELLSEAGETENYDIAFLERGLGTKNQLKINGYAISDNYETVDLFISLYEGSEEPTTIHKEDIDTAATRLKNFFRKAIYSELLNEIEESSTIFEFVNTLGTYKELRDSLIRVNAFILTNGIYKGEIPSHTEISGYKIIYRVFDINYLYQISEDAHAPITINLEEGGWQIPCLHAPSSNEDYDAYVAILPGDFLYEIYDIYGGRLLEQNVRSFLQFTGKINQGIRDTIKKAPHMFLAYNNGIAATADSMDVDSDGIIKSISNFQIVNGGQTTASIYHTKKKDKVDISNIYVQVKLSIVKRKDEYTKIVSDISKFANTQNKVNNADFSANNLVLVELEKVSRYVMTPITPERSMQTYWFFERARSQYKNSRLKEGFTSSRQKAFDLKYPKNQMFTKVELAKYINCFEEIYEGGKLVISPHIVVRGSEKNYAQFIAKVLPTNPKKITNVYFEDTIAKAILFKAADQLYGTKRTGNNIGELKSVVVPYTIGLLNHLTGGRIDLYRIWKNQKISNALSNLIYSLMQQVNPFIMRISPSNNYLEWAKKEECWLAIRNNKDWEFDLDSIEDDLIDPDHPVARKVTVNTVVNDKSEHDLKVVKSIPYKLWQKIADWGAESGELSLNLQSKAREIAHDLKFNHKLSSATVARGMTIFDRVCEENYDLLEEIDTLRDEEQKEKEQKEKERSTVKSINVNEIEIDIELIKRMVEWDKKNRVLESWKFKIMQDVAIGLKPLTEKLKWGFRMNLKTLLMRGFEL